MSRPLIVTSDPRHLDDLHRLTAAAATDADVVADPVAARRAWAAASLVLVGDDVAGQLVAARLPRRAGVLLVGLDLDDATVWQRGVEIGAERVVFLPDAEDWVVERLVTACAPQRRGIVLGVVGGRGGAGASTLAAALSVTARRLGHTAALVDADPLGGGLDVAFGAERAPGARWPELIGPDRVRLDLLPGALATPFGVPLLSWDRGAPVPVPPGAVCAVAAALGKELDLVVVDIARGEGGACLDAYAAVDLLLVVTTSEVRAVAATARVCAVAARYVADLRLVVRGPSSAGLDPELIGETLGLPVAERLRADRGLAGELPPGFDGPARSHLAKGATRLVRDIVREGASPGSVADAA